MRKDLLSLLALCIQIIFQSSLAADTLYDVNFGSPPHTIGLSPVVGGGLSPRNTPSSIPGLFTAPQVVQSLGTLIDQPCKFRVHGTSWYAQLAFDISPDEGGFSTIYPRYILEMDLYIEQLAGQYNDFTVFFDVPSIRTLKFSSNGSISYDVLSGRGTIGNFTLGQAMSLKIDVDLKQSTWKIWLDGKRIHSGPFNASALDDIRLSLGDRPDSGYGNVVAIDNVRIYGVTEPADINRDDVADMNDLSDFAANWLQGSCREMNGCEEADIDDDNQVSFADYALMARGWLKPANSLSVEAGPNQMVNYPSLSINLDGTITDDGLPNPPGAVTSQWSKRSGPGAVTFGNASAADTTAVFSQAGTYVLRLTANDGQLISCDDMRVMINQAPTADAGRDQIIAFPYNDAFLEGMPIDDGLPNPPGMLTTRWTQQSGPGTVVFFDANSSGTPASFPEFGTYVLRLTVDDGVFSAYDEMTVKYFEVMPENKAPAVNAGEDQLVFDTMTPLNATVTDDGLPYPPGEVTLTWTQQSGPGFVWFGNEHSANTDAMFTDYGVYVLRLTADDVELSSYDEITVTCQEPGENAAPWVNAGMDQAIILPDSAVLEGMVFDDGLPNPPKTLTIQWTKESGPGTVTFGDSSAANTTASFSQAGTYVLRLTASDSALSSYREVVITCDE